MRWRSVAARCDNRTPQVFAQYFDLLESRLQSQSLGVGHFCIGEMVGVQVGWARGACLHGEQVAARGGGPASLRLRSSLRSLRRGQPRFNLLFDCWLNNVLWAPTHSIWLSTCG